MVEKSAKKKPKKPVGDASVLGNLPSTRPTRLGGERRAATTRTTKPKATAAAKPKSAAKPKLKAAPKAKPQPARTGAPPAGWQVPGEGDSRRDGGPAELVTTAVHAAGELAQIGGRLLKRAAGRLPRP
jgi:hypothetical protein